MILQLINYLDFDEHTAFYTNILLVTALATIDIITIPHIIPVQLSIMDIGIPSSMSTNGEAYICFEGYNHYAGFFLRYYLTEGNLTGGLRLTYFRYYMETIHHYLKFYDTMNSLMQHNLDLDTYISRKNYNKYMLGKCHAAINNQQLVNDLYHQADLQVNNLQTAAESTQILFEEAERAHNRSVSLYKEAKAYFDNQDPASIKKWEGDFYDYITRIKECENNLTFQKSSNYFNSIDQNRVFHKHHLWIQEVINRKS